MTALLRRLADLAWSLAVRVLDWLFGPPPVPQSAVPTFIPQWVLEEFAELLPEGWNR